MRAVHGSTVLYPSDGTSTAALVEAMAQTRGISYLRTTRGGYPGLYPAGEKFPVGGSKLVRSADRRPGHPGRRRGDAARGAAGRRDPAGRGHRRAGHRLLLGQAGGRRDAGRGREATGGRIVVAEDHHPEGGLGSAVADALLAAGQQDLHLTRLAVSEMPGSGTGDGTARLGRDRRRPHRGRGPQAGGRLAQRPGAQRRELGTSTVPDSRHQREPGTRGAVVLAYLFRGSSSWFRYSRLIGPNAVTWVT